MNQIFIIKWYRQLSLSKKIYIATAMGLFIGIFFGELCSVLEPFNKLFIRVFQITIIPYMVFSILESIGSLDNETAKTIGKKGGVILLILWGVSIFYALCLRFSLPNVQRAKFFRPDDTTSDSFINLYDLFIPTNPFHSFANGYIPAIVIFSVLVGIAIIHQRKKASLIEYSKIMAELMKEVNNYITYLLPLGVLIMSSYTFGTLNLASFKAVLVYILASLIYLVFMSLVILPGLAVSMTRLKYHKFLAYSMPAVLIAFTTGSVFLALPLIYEMMHNFGLKEEQKGYYLKAGLDNEYRPDLVNIIVPLAWVVPATYKFLVIFFTVFAHWYYDSTISFVAELFTYIGGIPCLFGGNSATVPFLLEVSHVPSQAYNIFMLVSSFLVYFNNANGAIFIIVCTILCYASIIGGLRVRWSILSTILIFGTIIYIALIVGLNLFMGKVVAKSELAKDELLHMNLHSLNKEFYSDIEVSYLTMEQYKEIPFLDDEEPLLDKICRTKTLRVGYVSEAPPFSFFNQQKELVGFDIDTAYDMAGELDCNKLEFYEINNINDYQNYLLEGKMIDIYVGAHKYRGPIMDNIRTSDSYMEMHLAIVIPYKDKAKYSDFNSVFYDKSITVGFIAGSGKGSTRISNFSKAREFVELNSFSDYYQHHKTYALVTNAEVASGINIIYSGYWVMPYKEKSLSFHFAYILPSAVRADTLRDFVNSYIKTAFRSGKAKDRYGYWIMGQAEVKTVPHWSVVGWLQENRYFIIPEKENDNIKLDWRVWIGGSGSSK